MVSRREFLSMSRLALVPLATFAPAAPASTMWIARVDAPARQWCAADAPLLARLPAGSAAHLLDRLETPNGAWLALADTTGALIGWSPAGAWTAAG